MACNDEVVPLAFLHQKVYPAGRRLPAMKIMEIKKPDPPASRVISPSAGKFGFVVHNELLETDNNRWRYRYFYRAATGGYAVCRGCGLLCRDEKEITDHQARCCTIVNRVLGELFTKGKCVVCGGEINDSKSTYQYNRVPLCGDVTCLVAWKNGVPHSFTVTALEIKTPKSIIEA